MTSAILAAALFLVLTVVAHLASVVLAWRRCRARPAGSGTAQAGRVSIVRPVCGLDTFEAETLGSAFRLDHPDYEILFCVERADDPVVPLVHRLIAAHPGVPAGLLVGNERICANPKLNNVLKGWAAARGEWVVLADSNVLMPADYLQRLLAAWRADTGLVCSPPVGIRPEGFWAELECAFLNEYQARWQYAADSLGFGFAQGKSMLWRRAELEAAGGIAALGREIAEDAAATKVVRAGGRRVRLVDGPFGQPLGRRAAMSVWRRQLRWARLRRATFRLYFTPELLTGALFPAIAALVVAAHLGWPPAPSVLGLLTLWYGAELALTLRAGWPVSPTTPLALILRDLLIPVLWVEAWRGSDFSWRGNAMTATRARSTSMRAPSVRSLRPVSLRVGAVARRGSERLARARATAARWWRA
ncbi:ceramide glucosyltransferase [Ancylobacter terrae]|uniref:ceramide glucosyltransferase n=1 Tax=Ancylobacter sp. sgz301288 TaxID=3342077 RepID=UPI003859CB51